MEEQNTKSIIPAKGIRTPHGYLYHPPSQKKQVVFFITSFFIAIILGWIVSSIPGDLSDLAKGVLYFVYLLIFIIGYAIWASIMSLILLKSFKLPLIKIIFRYFIRRDKSASLSEILPSNEEIIKLLVRSQKSASAFFIVSWILGFAGAFASVMMKTSMNSAIFFFLVLITCILYGFYVFYFGRRGYLLFPEE
jgi:uncharacterized MAPEG superfamily protein